MKPLVLPCALLLLLCSACQRDISSSKAMGGLTPLDDARAPMPAPDALAVPVQFQGSWAESTQACGRPHHTQLQIGRDRVRFGERESVIVASTYDGRNLELQIQREGKGQISQARHRFTLSDDGDTLSDVIDRGKDLHFVRCRH
jgi:hypothetical protein